MQEKRKEIKNSSKNSKGLSIVKKSKKDKKKKKQQKPEIIDYLQALKRPLDAKPKMKEGLICHT